MPPTKDKIIIEKKSIELEEDPEECKKVLSFLQWKFERKFDKPSSPSVKPKKEHFFAFYNFYDECLRSSENNFEKKVCTNQKENIQKMLIHLYNCDIARFPDEYDAWCENKVFPSWE